MKPNSQVIAIVKNVKPYRGSPRSSDSSFNSGDSYSSSSSGSTPQSSLGSHSDMPKRGRGRSRTPVQRTKFPEHFGVTVPRQHSKHEQNYVMDSYPPRLFVSEQVPLPSSQFSSMDMDPLRQDRRAILRDDEPFRQDRRPILRQNEPFRQERRTIFREDEPFRQDRRTILREDEPSYTPRTTLLPPRIHQRGGVRLIAPSEARQELLQDGLERMESRLERLRLDAAYRDDEFRDEFRRDDERLERLAEEPRRRVVLPNRFRAEDPMAREHESRWPERDAHEYMRRQRELAHP
ncbi:hypothetical protein G7Z17_g12264 [Cylindrodendrum hubeiense]|uniref:Uncharacterized protein n=1 Tax=Cylindrodendrum hubeiense TaxID=595255 RepID=A0A9P5GY16_9HYPO|nr:hypothetical protein G7Z17_g12264 [Cylindrodendrum hubeiense]